MNLEHQSTAVDAASHEPGARQRASARGTRTRRRVRGQMNRPVVSDPITFWHWVSAAILVAGAIGAVVLPVT